MEKQIKVFENLEFGSVRTMLIDDEVWFVAKDVADKLGYQNGSRDVNRHTEEEDRTSVTIQDNNGQNRNMILINESGLYSLVLSSKLPTAKAFKRWITSEVIPSVRKHGGYLTSEKIEEALLNPDTLIQLATTLKEEREKRQQAEQKIEADKPKVLFAEAVATSKTSILVGEMAKILKQNGVEMGQNRLFDWLRNNGYLIKNGSSKNMPTQRAMEQGLFEIKESSVVNADGSIRVTKTPKLTAKAQLYFINLFLGSGEDEKEKSASSLY